MPEMATAVRADDLRPGHSESAVCVPCHRAWDAIEVCGPSAAGLEFVGGLVEGRIASGAAVDAFFRHVLVIFPSEWSFGSLFTQDAKLFCERIQRQSPLRRVGHRGPGRRHTFVENGLPFLVGFLDWVGHVVR
jgi:hypothetical protein